MNDSDKDVWFENIETVVADTLKFKSKLAIGEDAYTSLRVKNTTVDFWSAAGVATVTGNIASSATVASTFFAPTGILAFFGIGTAVTPIGWVIAVSLLFSGASIGLTRHLKKASSDKVMVIPKFINTPMDVLGLGLFDLMAPLAMKIAEVDNNIDELEREHITRHFVNEWGYDEHFVIQGIAYIESKLAEFNIKEVATILAEFKKANPDCNYKQMTKETIYFLKQIIEVDCRIDEREKKALEDVEAIFEEINQISFKKIASNSMVNIKEGAKNVIATVRRN